MPVFDVSGGDNMQSLGWLLGGLGLFLYGLDIFSRQLRQYAGEGFRRSLLKMTATPWHGLLAGTLITGILQSSSVVSALTVGLVEAGMLSFSQSLAVIIGANIGTTVTLQLLSLKVTQSAIWLISFGSIALLFWRWQYRYIAEIILALGLVFLGLNLMADAMHPMQNTVWMQSLLHWIDSSASAVLVGMVFTAVIQSSSAFGGIVLVMLSQGQVSIEVAIALMLGANIGTCVTVLLAAIGKSVEAVRVAFFHLFFNVAGVSLVLILFPWFVRFVRWLNESLTAAQLLANSMVIFNFGVALILIWFVPNIANIMRQLLPDNLRQGQLLQTPVLSDPENAQAGLEAGWRYINAMVVLLERLRQLLVSAKMDATLWPLFVRSVDELQRLDKELIMLLAQIGHFEMTVAQEHRLLLLLRLNSRLRSIYDLLGKRLPEQYQVFSQSDLVMSETTDLLYEQLMHRVSEQLAALLLQIQSGEPVNLVTIESEKQALIQLRAEIEAHHRQRIAADVPNRVVLHVHEMMLLESWMALSDAIRRAQRLLVAG